MIFIFTASMSLVSNTFHEWIIETSKHNNIFLISTDSNVLSCGTERDDPGARMGSQVRSLTWPGDVQVIRWPRGQHLQRGVNCAGTRLLTCYLPRLCGQALTHSLVITIVSS